MARYNEILIGRWNRFLQKLLQIKGGPPAPQLASEIAATFEIEQPPVEDRYLLQWNLFAWQQFVAANVGFSSQIRIRNPVGSNVIAVIEHAGCTNNTGAVNAFKLNKAQLSTDLPAALPGPIIRDLRTGTGQAVASLTGSSMKTTADNAVPVVGTTIDMQDALASTAVRFIWTRNQELTLLPGDSYSLSAQAANVALNATFWWRERFLEESERA
jgi:hypothetical protein